jgi:DNA mismatch repair protein MutL
MNRIRLLPEQVANQIAAGEVIERPASVVKELVENALDAGAARITIEIQAGGRSLIRVIDDGFGMSRDDALMSLERHATSKIRRAEDLASIDTMGFRGEALPSIASVSRFTLTTRERPQTRPAISPAGAEPEIAAVEAAEGTQIVVSGGKMLEVKAAGTAPGTTVEVRQLFFNLPARRKFLRTEETESAHILHYLTLAALSCPGVAFTFQRDGRLVWQLPAIASGPDAPGRLAALRERLRALYGGEQKMLTVDFTGEYADPPARYESDEPLERAEANNRKSRLRVWGFAGAPGVSRSTREDQHLFVNRRPVENRGLNFALLEGYHTALMKGRYPVCCLFLEIDPSAVDVNIHPAKREVKFHREADVRRLVAEAIRQTLLQFHTGPEAKNQPPAAEPPAARMPGAAAADPNVPRAAQPRTGSPSHALPGFSAPAAPPTPVRQAPLQMGFAPAPAVPGSSSATTPPANAPAPQSDSPLFPSQPGPGPAANATAAPTPLLSVPLRLVGVIGKLYVVLESDRGLVLLDQHAAHERILFERMLTSLERSEQAASQRLLLPETVELSARDASFLRDQLAVLTRLGVGLSEFGERTFLLDALPPFVKASDPRRFVLELVDELKAAGQDVNSLRLGEHTIAKTVCRHAVKANDPLAGKELEKLVEDLRACAMPYTCPHGRPTLIEMNFRELERKFGRTQ